MMRLIGLVFSMVAVEPVLALTIQRPLNGIKNLQTREIAGENLISVWIMNTA